MHTIPENLEKKEPEHYHYDIRFLFVVNDTNFKISDESTDIKWLSIEQAKKLVTEKSMLRMLNKAYQVYKNF